VTANSLFSRFFAIEFPVWPKKFPVRLRREFLRKPLNSGAFLGASRAKPPKDEKFRAFFPVFIAGTSAKPPGRPSRRKLR
jgi:hypothetical protein